MFVLRPYQSLFIYNDADDLNSADLPVSRHRLKNRRVTCQQYDHVEAVELEREMSPRVASLLRAFTFYFTPAPVAPV